MPLLVFVKFYCIDTMAVVSEKSWFGPCLSNSHVFKNAKKCIFFCFSQLWSSDGIWRLRAHFVVCRFAWVQQLLPDFQTTSFKSFLRIPITHAHTCLLKNVRFYLIFGAFEEWLFVKLSNSHWRARQCFSLLTIFAFIVFFTKKTPQKSWFFCVLFYRCEFLPKGNRSSILV